MERNFCSSKILHSIITIIKQSFKVTIERRERRIDIHTSLAQEDHQKHKHNEQMLVCLTLLQVQAAASILQSAQRS